jgi:phospho-N-acetylmuramoyl-pentapeptide-transferase
LTGLYIPYSVLIFLLSLSIALVTLKGVIPKLKALAKQPIYEDGPIWHLSKSGTPTMGGIAFLFTFIIASSISLLLFHSLNEKDEVLSVILLICFSALNGAIGLVDDITKLKRKQNKGLSALQKLALQGALAAVFLTLRAYLFNDGTSISFFTEEIGLGFFYYPFSMVLILGAINCANLTDGIDGLLSSVAFIDGVVMTIIFLVSNSPYALITVSLVGMTLAFLFYNIAPAKIFMGDTGSLFIGAMLISTVYSVRRPEYFFSLGAVFIIEGISVILQVAFFKWKKKRLFLMSPLHHHLEKRGFSENQICIMAIIFTILCSLPILISGGI